MKRFQVGFAAIIAILAMSFTFGSKSHSGVTNFKVTDGCYQQVTLSYTNPPAATVSVTITAADLIILGTPPFAAQDQSSSSVVKISKSKFPGQSVDLALPLIYDVRGVANPLTPATQCPSPYQKFCCFKVVSNQVTAITFRSN